MNVRAFVVSQLVFATVLGSGRLLAGESELGVGLTLFAAFGLGIAVLLTMEARDARRAQGRR
jgi:hypothetical protein